MIFNLICIQIIICFIIDLSGIISSIKELFYRRILGFKNMDTGMIKLPLIGCSLCMTWWCGIFYLAAKDSFLTGNDINWGYIVIIAILSYLAEYTSLILILIKDLLGKGIAVVDEWINGK